jgi:N-acetylglutamate synthase
MLIAPPFLPGGAGGPACDEVADVHYRLEVRLTPADVGQRVVIRWRRPAAGGGVVVADVLGILEEADAGSFAVRTRDGKLVVVPAGHALAGKVVPPPPARRRSAGPAPR